MLKLIEGFILATFVSGSQTRGLYRVLDPFSSNGLWTNVATNPESEASSSFVQPRIEETEDAENREIPASLVERKAEVTKNNVKARKQKIKPVAVKREQAHSRDARHVAKPTPYLPDLTALKQITGVDPLATRPESSLEAFKRNLEQEGPPLRSDFPQPRPPVHKRHQHKPLPSSLQLNVAPAMPQLPSLAAATNAPLPPSYPHWETSLASMLQPSRSTATSLLEMDSSSGVQSQARESTSPDISHFQLLEKPLSARAPWPSDVSPPADYFLPPEVLL